MHPYFDSKIKQAQKPTQTKWVPIGIIKGRQYAVNPEPMKRRRFESKFFKAVGKWTRPGYT